MPTYYFDTNALWKYYAKNERGWLDLRRLDREDIKLISSLTQIEFISRLMKEYRRGSLRKSQTAKIVERLRRDINSVDTKTTRPFTATEIPARTFRRAEALLLTYGNMEFSSFDSLHISIAENLRLTYIDLAITTSDRGMKNVCDKIALPFYDPELEP